MLKGPKAPKTRAYKQNGANPQTRFACKKLVRKSYIGDCDSFGHMFSFSVHNVPCRILRSVLLSAAVIVVRPVLVIEVGTHWRQVKGIKSYLREQGVKVKQHICGCHSVDVIMLMSLC